MTLKWQDQGNGSYYATDETTGLSARVLKSGTGYFWFIADFPVRREALITAAATIIADVEAKQAKNSTNSSLPPSSERPHLCGESVRIPIVRVRG